MPDLKPISEAYACTVTVISPLHVGNGEKWQQDVDFIASSSPQTRGHTVQVLHRQRLFQAVETLGAEAIEDCFRAIEEGNFADWLRKNGLIKKAGAYSASWPEKWPPREIHAQIRDGFGRPLLPGSSLKGALRTAVLAELTETEAGQSVLRKEVELYAGTKPNNPKFADQQLCRRLLGQDPNHNLMRTLSVGDICFAPEALNLHPVHADRLVNSNVMQRKFVLATEVLCPGAEGTGTVSFDRYLQRADQEEHCFRFRQQIGLQTLLADIRRRTESAIIHEQKFFRASKGRHNAGVAAFYEDLQQQHARLEENQAIIQLAWGSGWRAMTGSLLDEADWKHNPRLRDNLRLAAKYRDFPFPKSRKVVQADNDLLPMGWVRLTFEPMAEVRLREKEQRRQVKESREKEKAEQAKRDAEKRRQAKLAAMSEEDRALVLLREGELSNEQITDIFRKLDDMPDEAQSKVAQALKERWQKQGKWNVKAKKKKQFEKVSKIKEILGE